MPEAPVQEPDIAAPVEQTDLVHYKAPLIDRALASTAESAATTVDWVRIKCEEIAGYIRHKVHSVLSQERTATGIKKPFVKLGALVFRNLDIIAVRTRVGERVPIHHLPQLLPAKAIAEDPQADILHKGDITDFLDSRIFVDLPFIDGIEPIAKQAFDKEIPPEALIAYFETEEILDLIIHEILTVKDSRFRSSNLTAAVWSGFKGVARRLRSFAARQRKKPITGEIEQKLKDNLQFMKDNFDPTDIDHTISRLIQKLRNDYPDYDIDTWFKKNKKVLMQILLGKQIGTDGPSHISRIVYEIYENRGKGGKERLKEFIRLHLPLFLTYEEAPEDTPYLRALFTASRIKCEPVLMLDMDFLKIFFGDILPRVQTKGDSIAELRNMIIEAITDMTDKLYPQVHNIILMRDSLRPSHTLIPLANPSSVKKIIAENIKTATQSVSSHVDVAELLADPTESSQAVEQAYRQCFTDEGEPRAWRKEDAFYAHLRSMVGVIDVITEDDIPVIRRERFENIERRLKECLNGADAILAQLDKILGFPSEIQYENITGEDDYATLVKIAHTAETLQERFAARLKLELAMVDFSIRYAPRSRFQKHDAEQLRIRLENSPNGVAIDTQAPLREIYFLDRKSGEIEISDFEIEIEGVTPDADSELRKTQLIPGTFGNINCWFAPVASDEEQISNERAYIDSKSDVSKALKVIRRDETRAKDITDITRMTIVVDSITDMNVIREYIESDYLSFGQVIKTENRYYGFVRVRTTANVHKNVASSGEYNALRYVVDMPIRSRDGDDIYLAPIEIRVLFVEDYLKEKSHHHPASHEKYELERAKICAGKLRPREVWPELYKEVCPFTGKPGPDPNDPWQRTKVVLKDPEDFLTSEAA